MKNTTFHCDLLRCKKKVEIDEVRYPYKKGWVYLYGTNFKTKERTFIEAKDKPFCCEEHLFEYLKMQFNLSKKEKK